MQDTSQSSGKTGNAWIYLACALALLASNAILAWKVLDLSDMLRASARGADPGAILKLLDTPLAGEDGKQWMLESASGPVVLFAFTPDDCGPCLVELNSLNQLESQGARVFALMSYGGPDEARQTRENFNVHYPILLDQDGKIHTSLRLPKTPWKIVVDSRHRRILYEDFPSVTQAERDAFVSRLSMIH